MNPADANIWSGDFDINAKSTDKLRTAQRAMEREMLGVSLTEHILCEQNHRSQESLKEPQLGLWNETGESH